MISFITSLNRNTKEDKDWIKFLHCVFNHDIPARYSEKGEAIFTVKEEHKERFLSYCYRRKILCGEINEVSN